MCLSGILSGILSGSFSKCIFFDKFVRKSFSALFFAVDTAYNFLHCISSEKFPGLSRAAIESQAADAAGILCKYDHLVKKIDDTVRRVCDDDDDLAAVRDLTQLRKKFTGDHAVQA